MIEITQGDVLSSQADALVLTIDGEKRGMGGNIARSFARPWPDAWMEIKDEIRYPPPWADALPFVRRMNQDFDSY